MNYFNTGMYATKLYGYTATKTVNTQKTQVAKTNNSSFSDTIKKAEQKESVVDKYKKKNPKDATVVESMVRAGQRVLAKNNAENVSREDMTMEEYKQFFTQLMNSIPFDSSQRNDVEVWTISEKGWEQMKNDPQYEAWVLGYTAQDRAVHNPWASMPGYSPNFHTESFGASIEEHLGQSGPMGGSMGTRKTQPDDGESWWEKRHKRMEELLEEWEKESLKKVGVHKKDDVDENAFEQVAPNAPEEVKNAWIEAATETGVNGLGIQGNGMLSHISQMMVQRLNIMLKGEGNTESVDILGNTTESAILATKQALYNLEHPIAYTPKSIEVQQACIKERQFYISFLEKLKNL